MGNSKILTYAIPTLTLLTIPKISYSEVNEITFCLSRSNNTRIEGQIHSQRYDFEASIVVRSLIF